MDYRGVFEYRKPYSGTWTFIGWDEIQKGFKWKNIMGIIAISAIADVEGKPFYHCTFTHLGQRIDRDWMLVIAAQWGLEGFSESTLTKAERSYWKEVVP